MKITKRKLRRIIREAINESQTAGPPISGAHAIALGGSYYEPEPPEDEFAPPTQEENDNYDRGYQDGFDGTPQDQAGGLGYFAGYEAGENAHRDEEEQGIEGRALHRRLSGMED